MNIWFLAPRWGSEQLPPEAFLEKVKAAGYQGVEMPLPSDDQERDRWISLLRQFNLRLVVQQWETERVSTLEDHLALLETVIRSAAAANPLFINSQTGKDYFTFEQNCRLLEVTAALAAETGIQIAHEIHRGKFSFHPLTSAGAAHGKRCWSGYRSDATPPQKSAGEPQRFQPGPQPVAKTNGTAGSAGSLTKYDSSALSRDSPER
jgi:hypothetical protein